MLVLWPNTPRKLFGWRPSGMKLHPHMGKAVLSSSAMGHTNWRPFSCTHPHSPHSPRFTSTAQSFPSIACSVPSIASSVTSFACSIPGPAALSAAAASGVCTIICDVVCVLRIGLDWFELYWIVSSSAHCVSHVLPRCVFHPLHRECLIFCKVCATSCAHSVSRFWHIALSRLLHTVCHIFCTLCVPSLAGCVPHLLLHCVSQDYKVCVPSFSHRVHYLPNKRVPHLLHIVCDIFIDHWSMAYPHTSIMDCHIVTPKIDACHVPAHFLGMSCLPAL
jgi:hypothetical protein